MTTIAIGADHGGVALKGALVEFLGERGYVVMDYGTFGEASVDYPDFAKKVCKALIMGEAGWGILICKTGIGMSIAANKFQSIRAALVQTTEDAKLARLHNNANVLCLGAKNTSEKTAREIAETFLKTPFEGGRHQERLGKIGC